MTENDRWADVDAYLEANLLSPDPVLEECLKSCAAAGLPHIQVSPTQGKLLQLIAQALGARRVLEVGTLGGYSGIWLTRAIPPDGRLITLELEPKHAEVARANFARAGLEGMVEVRVGPARASLERLKAEKPEPFDLVFIDADKPNTRRYFDSVLELTRPGSIILVDNVVRQGELANPMNPDASVRGMREFVSALAGDRRVSATVIQTVGAKGYDGFLLARVEGACRQNPAPSVRRSAKK
jgi:predicted O-methyltransferase YrrM